MGDIILQYAVVYVLFGMVHSLNALFPIEVTLFGTITDARLVHPSNAFYRNHTVRNGHSYKTGVPIKCTSSYQRDTILDRNRLEPGAPYKCGTSY